MALTITKASGQQEEFRTEKLVTSLIRSGASPDVAEEIAGRVRKSIEPYATTRQIYRLAKSLLRRRNHVSLMRYSLKQAIASLGPSGFPFEKYFARVLAHYGYSVQTNQIVLGRCVKHEVDILANREAEYSMIECKYHTAGGKTTDVKIALYVFARFLDLQNDARLRDEKSITVRQGWLVTNTRCTSDAIQYAECAGLKIVSWRYPKQQSLESMIEQKRLYPVTILPGVKKESIDALLRSEIVLAQDIADKELKDFIRLSRLDTKTASLLKRQADSICPCAVGR